MIYENFTAERFFSEITTKEEARDLIWRSRFDGERFRCRKCKCLDFYDISTRPEVRTCKGCRTGAMVNTDGKFKDLDRVDHDYQVVSGKTDSTAATI